VRVAARAGYGAVRAGYNLPEVIPMAGSSSGGRGRGDFFSRVGRMFETGPFSWMLNALPRRRRARPGPHLHGLDHHDVEEKDPGFGGTDSREMPKTPSPDPPGR
jgi:hypothetical protein